MQPNSVDFDYVRHYVPLVRGFSGRSELDSLPFSLGDTPMNLSVCALALLLVTSPQCSSAERPRSPAVKAAFRHLNPCPSTGRVKGACPGFVVDHRRPLCAGGADSVENMQWQSVEAAGIKDRFEWAECAQLRRGER